ncbi:MAG: c-type cytochrome domain-containing protein [Pirellulales bacterium]
MKSFPALSFFAFVVGLSIAGQSLSQQTTTEAETFVQLQKHVQPILEQQCLKCHGPGDAKGGLRVDDMESLKGYIQAGSADQSPLWTDYLHTKDPDSLMPPEAGAKPAGLSTGDLLIIRTWINEGATGEWLASASSLQQDSKLVIPESDAGKFWAFQGLFHPAATHLPIALLAVSALFVAFSFYNRDACEPVAYHCLWVGAVGAIIACMTGWSYAVYEGYGADFSFDLDRKAIDRHRWLGVFVAVFSLLLIPLAQNVRKTHDVNRKVMWFFASLIMLGAVSVVGFQGGELTYGEGHYGKYFKLLFSSPATTTESNQGVDPSLMRGENSSATSPSSASAPQPNLPASGN